MGDVTGYENFWSVLKGCTNYEQTEKKSQEGNRGF